MAGTEERAEGVDVPGLERGDDTPDALVLGRHVTETARVAALDLGTPLRVARVLERVTDAGVDHDDRHPGRERDVAVLLAAAI